MDAPTVSALAAVVAAGAAVIGAVRSFFNARAIQEVHLSVNSRLDQLLNATSAKAHSDGVVEGARQVRDATSVP